MDHERAIVGARESEQSAKEELDERLRTSSESAVTFRERIVKLKERIDTATSADRQIGTVFVTSGVKLSPENRFEGGCRMDWGLIDLAAERVGINKVSCTTAEYEARKLTSCSIWERTSKILSPNPLEKDSPLRNLDVRQERRTG